MEQALKSLKLYERLQKTIPRIRPRDETENQQQQQEQTQTRMGQKTHQSRDA